LVGLIFWIFPIVGEIAEKQVKSFSI